MRRINISQAKPGMILDTAAARRDGMTILPAGAELNAANLDRLTRLGVEYLNIRGDTLLDCTEDELDLYRRRIERLPHLFRAHTADPWMDKIRLHLEAFLNRRIIDCSGQEPEPQAGQPGQEGA